MPPKTSSTVPDSRAGKGGKWTPSSASGDSVASASGTTPKPDGSDRGFVSRSSSDMSSGSGHSALSSRSSILSRGSGHSRRQSDSFQPLPSIYGYGDGDSDDGPATFTDGYDSNSRGFKTNGDDEVVSPFMQVMRKPSVSRAVSEQLLAESLSKVKEYNDRAEKIQQLKEQFDEQLPEGKKKKKKRFVQRRGSMSTISRVGGSSDNSLSNFLSNSDNSMSFGSESMDLLSLGGDQSLNVNSVFEERSIEPETVLAPAQLSRKSSFGVSRTSSFNEVFNMSLATNNTMSTNQISNVERYDNRYNNAPNRTDQIIESLVWFSFHIPRTVLEDLIHHELSLWKNEQAEQMKRPGGDAVSRRRDRRKSEEEGTDSADDCASVKSTSDEGEQTKTVKATNTKKMIELPKCVFRESALLFVDMSGFTKLSTMLDVESLSKVINSYFDMIVSEVILHGGDILKFAGDAFFAEWKVSADEDDDNEFPDESRRGVRRNPLKDLNASLASINELAWDDDDVPKLSHCVYMAAKCGRSIVRKFSDYKVPGVFIDPVASSGTGVGKLQSVTTTTNTASDGKGDEAMLNVHCGVGVGKLVGLHVTDYREDQEEEGVELRREFLLLGDAIDQVSRSFQGNEIHLQCPLIFTWRTLCSYGEGIYRS
jgi:class 3 adenylate cyclase